MNQSSANTHPFASDPQLDFTKTLWEDFAAIKSRATDALKFVNSHRPASRFQQLLYTFLSFYLFTYSFYFLERMKMEVSDVRKMQWLMMPSKRR